MCVCRCVCGGNGGGGEGGGCACMRAFSHIFDCLSKCYSKPTHSSKDVALLSLIVIVQQSSSFVFVWLCIVLLSSS